MRSRTVRRSMLRADGERMGGRRRSARQQRGRCAIESQTECGRVGGCSPYGSVFLKRAATTRSFSLPKYGPHILLLLPYLPPPPPPMDDLAHESRRPIHSLNRKRKADNDDHNGPST
ncbi:hypothetical protein C8Q74DRAFT_1457461, partial [Fomes fomentarius]